MTAEVAGQQTPLSTASHYNALVFVIAQQLRKLNTVTLVTVVAVDTVAETVDVQPLVNQVTGTGTPVPHGTIYGVPYFRLQGGANAVIIDPQPGDIGMAAFCARDISKVKATKAAALPGSHRIFDWADGLYFGGMLNGTPTQTVAFASGGITVTSPTKITLVAPTVEIDASTELKVVSPNSHFDGPITATGDVTGEGTSLHTHVHSGVTSGGSNSGPPV
jgi:hypothetical protein